jgi:hypothetical protein
LQKGRWFFFSRYGLPPFLEDRPFSLASLCGKKERRTGQVSSGVFGIWALSQKAGVTDFDLASTNISRKDLKNQVVLNKLAAAGRLMV